MRSLLDEALDSLTADLRAPFVLFELEGMSLDEIAEALDIPRGTVASRLRRARKLFQDSARRLKLRDARGQVP
jgi:RNA polymerase sigma-70 factor (ECF subfamily)